MAALPNNSGTTFPLLEQILAIEGLSIKSMYSVRDIAELFRVSVRAIQNRVTSGQLVPRNLPGRAKFLAQDVESFLAGSGKGGC
jgi:hypothetical protein